jgi:hypothetical protein
VADGSCLVDRAALALRRGELLLQIESLESRLRFLGGPGDEVLFPGGERAGHERTSRYHLRGDGALL